MAPVDWLTRLWRLYHAGKGCFPLRMGLTPAAWRSLQQRLGEVATPLDSATLSRRRLMTELNATRDEERRQLGQWLTEWMAPGPNRWRRSLPRWRWRLTICGRIWDSIRGRNWAD